MLLKNYAIHPIKIILICLGICIIYSCGSQKDTAANRKMQNLTARYNYLYNSNVLVQNYEEDLSNTYVDNYNQILPVYIAPAKFNPYSKDPFAAPVNSAALDKVILKAQTIIAEKSFSNYVDDAYMLLGKAQFLKGNYFFSKEYYDYVIKTYPENRPVYIQALNGRARSLLQLNDLRSAGLTLDTLEQNLNEVKNHKAEPLATLAQMGISVHRYKDAIIYLEAALKAGTIKRNQIRWTYVLAQLYEHEKDYPRALRNYVKVQKSNAAFELYFNANLSRIRLNALTKGVTVDRKQQLTALLKDDKNAEYIDQIYYQIGESYEEDKDYANAEKFYKRSIAKSFKNPYQKGLSYLKIADLSFKQNKDYLKAKLYYDSTVNTLPETYAGYELILKKAQNLEYLTLRYESISLQDTLQSIAKLPEPERKPKIESLFAKAKAASTVQENKNPGKPNFPGNPDNEKNAGVSTFYFGNTVAVSRGLSDFKTKWGNRKLEDDWRQSVRSSSQTNTQYVANLDNTGLPKEDIKLMTGTDSARIKAYMEALPLSPAQLSTSNQKILDAYYEIANFYQQELNDNEEAARIYEIILKRFPENNHLAAINYGLYLSYKDKDPAKAAVYKNVVLSQFASSIYAKTILDPDFSVKRSEKEADVAKKYNTVFDQYVQKDFPGVITAVNTVLAQSPDNYLSPQFAYLKSIAIGRTNPVDSLIKAFKNIIGQFPDDKLITPLVHDHLSYIEQHLAEFRKRKIALTDFDPNEPRFMEQQATPQTPVKPAEQIIASLPAAAKPEPVVAKAAEPEKTAAAPAVKSNGIFSTAVSSTYYFVIDVADASLTLSSSRFGIGQFNRGNYTGSNLKHQLTEFDNDQLIYVGNFSSFDDAKIYADEITPQLKQIMKVPASIYTSFIISKENFEKLKSKDLLNKYLEFYKTSY